MVSSRKMTPWLMAIFCLATAGCSNITDQQTSETSHDQQVAILKQIRKVNEDGSYTYGYEAGDGSFKVETRDVLGNIKGTFGFVDAEGEIKRVSYSSSNGTGFKATTVSPLQEHISVVQSIPRLNRTSTTKKPTILFTSSTESPTKSSVVQSIPRTRKTTTTSTTTTSTTTTEQPKTIFSHYLKGPGKSRPRFVINGQQRPIDVVEENTEDEDSQINRPVTEEKSNGFRRVVFTRRPVDLRPISEDFVEKEEETKITTGNTLRRQLHDETTKSNPPGDNVNSDDEHSDVYGGALSTTRPLFTTTNQPKVLQRVPGIRVDRTRPVFVNQDNIGPARFDNTKYEGPRIYEAETKPTAEERTTTQQVLIRGPPRVPVDNRDYVRQSTEPIYVRQQPEQYLQDVTPRILLQQQQGLEDPGYRPVSLGRILFRPIPNQQSLYPTTTDPNVHYLTEAPVTEAEEDPRIQMNPNYARSRPFPRPPLIYPDQDPRTRPILRPVPQPQPPIDDREYQQTTPEYPYRNTIALPPEPPNPIAPPLSRRDFQMLLRRLLVSQYGVQALSYPKTYLEDALYDQQPYPNYAPTYPAPLPRHDLAYDPQVTATVQYGERVPLRRPVYARPINPVYQNQQYDDYQDARYPKRVYRQKFYGQDVADDGDEILPGPIREALLLRMLQLAINPERSTVATTMAMATTTPTTRYRKTGPVRSVQIITDEDEEEKDAMRKKV